LIRRRWLQIEVRLLDVLQARCRVVRQPTHPSSCNRLNQVSTVCQPSHMNMATKKL
jgi:hypothetical protein